MDFPCYCSTTLVLESEMNVFFAFAIAQEWNNTRCVYIYIYIYYIYTYSYVSQNAETIEILVRHT